MNKADTYNSGVRISPTYSSISTATAGGTGDATEVTGATVDRLGFGSAAVAIAYTTTLAATKTLSLAVSVQESDDGTNWDTAEVLQAATVQATGDTGGSTETGVLKIVDSYETRARYVRYNVTPDLSNTATDTASIACVVVLGGAYNGTAIPLE